MGANDKVIKAVSVLLDGGFASLTIYDENLRVIGRQEAPLAYQELSKKPPCICLPGLLGTAPECPVHSEAEVAEAEPNQTLRKQSYDVIDPSGRPIFPTCKGCGAVVGNVAQHDLWHSKTRSIV